MGWHSGDSKNDGMLRRPRDSKAWKQFNSIHNQFALDPRNMCLALAIADFSPFGLIWTTNDLLGLATLYRWETYTGLASHLVTLTLHPIISKLAANDVFGKIIVFLIRGIDLD